MLDVLMAAAYGSTREQAEPGAESNPTKGGAGVHWDYAKNGPERWGRLSDEWRLCAEGKAQSPIDLPGIVDTRLQPSDSVPALQIAGSVRATEVVNDGRTLMVSADGLSLTVGDTTFDLEQYHFHAPSEHTVEGRYFPLEMHLVHRSRDSRLAVLGLLIEEGSHNESFDALWSQLPLEPGTTVRLEGPALDLGSLLPADRLTYRYLGSLTTPPCSEGIQWLVAGSPIHLGREQIAAFEALFRGNNRPIQPLRGRLISIEVLAEG